MSGFSVSLEKFAVKAVGNVEQTKRAVAIKLFGAVIMDTPVSDEETSPGATHGRLRGNWQSSVASPLLGEIPRTDKSGTAATAEAVKAANEAKGDDTIYLRNNLPYAARIEFDGWSHTKAPAGMLRKNVARFAQLVSQQAREANK